MFEAIHTLHKYFEVKNKETKKKNDTSSSFTFTSFHVWITEKHILPFKIVKLGNQSKLFFLISYI